MYDYNHKIDIPTIFLSIIITLTGSMFIYKGFSIAGIIMITMTVWILFGDVIAEILDIVGDNPPPSTKIDIP